MASIGTCGPPRGAADYFPTTLMAAVLGGGFSSRLNMNLREDKGYAYGARGRVDYPLPPYGVVSASAQVQDRPSSPRLRPN